MATLDEMLKAGRIARGLTQYELADMIGVRNTSVSTWELGKVLPTPENMVALIDVLGLDPDEAAATYLAAFRR